MLGYVSSLEIEAKYHHLLMDRRALAQLVDAYADAKASRNQHLINSMVAQLEQALDQVFPSEAVEPDVMGPEY